MVVDNWHFPHSYYFFLSFFYFIFLFFFLIGSHGITCNNNIIQKQQNIVNQSTIACPH